MKDYKISDISDIECTEEALRKTEEKYRTLYESNLDGILFVDMKGNITDANKALLDMLGYSKEKIKKLSYQKLTPKKWAKSDEAALEEIMENGYVKDYEKEYIRKDGTKVPVSLNVWLKKNEQGEPIGMCGITKEITESNKDIASKERYSWLLESLNDGVLIIDRDWRYLSINDKVAQMVQMPKEKLISNKMTELFPGVEETIFGKTYKQVLETGEPAIASDEFNFPDGRKIWYEVQVYPVPEGLLILLVDITEKKHAEEALRKKTYELGERVKELDCLSTASKIMVEPNSSMDDVFKKIVDIVPPSWQYSDVTCARITFEGRKYQTNNFKETTWKQSANIKLHNKKKGTLEVYYLQEKPESHEGPSLKEERNLIDGLARELGKFAEHKYAEAARREAEELLGTTLKSIGDAVISTDEMGNINFMNHTAEKLTGWSTEKVTGKPLEKVFKIRNEDTGKKVESPVSKVLREGKVVGLANHTILINKDGKKIPIADSGAPMRSEGNKIKGTVLVFQDITERRQVEREVQWVREYAENIIATVREPLMVLGADLKVISANRSFYQTYKVKPKETEGRLLYDLGNRQWDIPKLRKLLEEILPKNTKFDNYEVEHKFETIGQRTMLLNARRIYRETNKTQMILIAIEDITERKKSEEKLKEYSENLEEMVETRTQELRDTQEQLVKKEKLAVLGQLAGGVGHELRNPLGAIKNAAYFLNMAIEKPEPEVKESLKIIDAEVTTSDRIISGLLDFARTKPPTRRKVDINEIVRESVSRITIPENIKVVNRLDETLPTTLADSDQLKQIFGNIISNAIQAMDNGGRVTIKSKMIKPEQIAISFTDTGVGIPKENLGKLFEPLFTSKAKGIGLGLVIVKSLIEGHGGTIDVKSDPGIGSTFTIKLPTNVKEGE